MKKFLLLLLITLFSINIFAQSDKLISGNHDLKKINDTYFIINNSNLILLWKCDTSYILSELPLKNIKIIFDKKGIIPIVKFVTRKVIIDDFNFIIDERLDEIVIFINENDFKVK